MGTAEIPRTSLFEIKKIARLSPGFFYLKREVLGILISQFVNAAVRQCWKARFA
jgi:hypothetical protein